MAKAKVRPKTSSQKKLAKKKMTFFGIIYFLKDMIILAEKLKTNHKPAEDQEVSDMMLDIGLKESEDIVALSPGKISQEFRQIAPYCLVFDLGDCPLSKFSLFLVTKKISRNLFHVELARQICDFVKLYLPKNNGIISLVDVYCLYNRARGTGMNFKW